jgi:cell migration-inducing and hyaluronan-binding protein
MAGTAKLTRETLTVNNGTYYLDTTVPMAVQQMEKFNTQNGGQSSTTSFNVFQPGDTYYVFFVYAKPTTRQTYQIYLGKNATASAIKSIQVRLDNLNNITNLGDVPWLATDPSQVATSGILSVTADFTKLTDHSLDTVPANGLCQPLTFCKASGTTCGSALTDSDPLVIANPNIKQQADAICSQWAVKDLDCPPKGCYGFSFTIPGSGFDTTKTTISNPSPYRPAPMPFPATATNPDGSKQGQPTWLAKFLITPVEPDAIGGQCHYDPTMLPGTTCTVPDWVPVPP